MDRDVPSTEDIDVYLLFINLHALTFAYILKGIFFKKKILILNDLEILDSHFKNFLKVIFQGTFDNNIQLINRSKYKINKKQYIDYIIIDEKTILNDKDKIMNIKSMKIERAIVQKFLAENDSEIGLIVFKSEIQKSYYLSKEVIEFNNNLRNENYTSKKMLDNFINVRNFKISYDYLDFLVNMVNNYFEVELSRESKASDFFGF